jgi:hypothetical protein
VIAVAAVAAALLAPVHLARADEDTSLERKVKAACLYKFASYVEWPAHAFTTPEEPVTIGVLGDETLAEDLRRLVAGRKSGGRPIAVRPVRDLDALYELRVLFVADRESRRIEEIAAAAEGGATLVVTETKGAIGRGTMINFVLHEGRVRFDVDLTAVARGGLTLSSRLLAVAQNVVPGPR